MNSNLNWLQTRVADGDIEKLSEADLLSLVLSNDKVAEAVINRFGGFRGLAYQPFEKLLDIHGLGEAKVIRIAACFEMARRVVDDVLLYFPSSQAQGVRASRTAKINKKEDHNA